jgi:hypothetical protein
MIQHLAAVAAALEEADQMLHFLVELEQELEELEQALTLLGCQVLD